jgi:hypothetical protein
MELKTILAIVLCLVIASGYCCRLDWSDYRNG